MTSLANVRTLGINVASSLATRYVISNYARLPKNQALVFNSVDMTVNAVTSYLYGKFRESSPSDAEFAFALFAARAISVISAIIITSQTVGPVHLRTAIALNGIALAIGFILRAVENKQCGDVALFIFV